MRIHPLIGLFPFLCLGFGWLVCLIGLRCLSCFSFSSRGLGVHSARPIVGRVALRLGVCGRCGLFVGLLVGFFV